ncbi:MAG: hypothetical protein Q9184_001684 [Pyrenodesmia sp. 2 TL-2023]
MSSPSRNDFYGRPPQYRTPSPPASAFEPCSPLPWSISVEAPPYQKPVNEPIRPTFTQLNNDHPLAIHEPPRESSSSHDAMDTFASIALSTTSGWPTHGKRNAPEPPLHHQIGHASGSSERPAKRARSERVPSQERARGQSNAAARPSTGSDTTADSRMMAAEMLLYLSQAAIVSAPATMGRYDTHAPKTVPADTNPNPAHDQSARPLMQERQSLPFTDDMKVQAGPTGDLIARQDSEPAESAPEHSVNATAMSTKKSSAPEIPSLDFREQLVAASESAHHQVQPPEAAYTGHFASMPHHTPHVEEDDEIAAEESQKDDIPAMQDRVFTSEELETCKKDALGQSLVESEVNARETSRTGVVKIEEYPTIQDRQPPATGYWPSMLAITVELSAYAWKSRLSQALEGLESNAQQSGSDTGVRAGSVPTNARGGLAQEPATCAACKFMRNSMNLETDGESASWISCDGCKSWFHFACAGFKNEREVRAVDKYRCKSCRAVYGPTTFVRKSSRAHTAIDYAGLNQGVVQTSDERPEHHYIKPIKEGTINLQPENFARMRPELVTAEYFEKGNGMKEPVVVPAHFNPRPEPAGYSQSTPDSAAANESDMAFLEDWFSRDPEYRNVPDHGQDALDMVIPHDLTVRKVAELYGPEEKVEVIDVKSQNGEGKKWNMRRWADYYESTTNKVVRNVISLEVSQSTLGRLIRRPQIVRDLDLQDSVWPAELQAKGEIPRVQFYCLMSVADCFTDFHIDFGGSSVFYHILKGKKTFFFIPPKEKHLKKYEDWCMSPAQNWTFLGDQTKECYRVDLSEGDTMLIPAGWIHAVWTPEDSLVIGGNFLTRLNYSMQLRIAQIEKATGVARKFRYPHFQKIQWYTAIRYLEQDPLPGHVRSDLQSGGIFHRTHPAYHDFDAWGENSRSGPENYHARYYSQPELEGLPDLVRYLLRTALIDSGDITEGITAEARNAVKKSIPRGFGEPLEVVKNFALWCAWKRGNESIPHWAYPDAVPEIRTTDGAAKLSAASLKKLDRQTALQAPRRHSARNQVQQPLAFLKETEMGNTSQSELPALLDDPVIFPNGTPGPYKTPLKYNSQQRSQTSASAGNKKRKTAPGEIPISHRKTACESCRRRRRACKHKSEQQPHNQATIHFVPTLGDNHQMSTTPLAFTDKLFSEVEPQQTITQAMPITAERGPENNQQAFDVSENIATASQVPPNAETADPASFTDSSMPHLRQHAEFDVGAVARRDEPDMPKPKDTPKPQKAPRQKSLSLPQSKPRSKACNDCRKSKRRCIHDENGFEDPAKAREAATPRPAGANKRRKIDHDPQDIAMAQHPGETSTNDDITSFEPPPAPSAAPVYEEIQQRAPAAVMVAIQTPAAVDISDEPALSVGMDLSQDHLQDMSPGNGAAETTGSQPLQNNSRPESTNLTPPSNHDQETNGHSTQRSAQSRGSEGFQLRTGITPSEPPKYDLSTHLETTSSFEAPAASSLVSPPESSHEFESDQVVPTSADKSGKPAYSDSSSRHSSHHPMQQTQRFTPESGPTRRDSTSSIIAGENPSPMGQGLAPDSAQTRARMRTDSEVEADEESLKLIKALQAQEYGLRRRGRAQ